MSHEIDTMAYAGKVPWHSLGTYVGDTDVDAETMVRAAGLDWTVEKRRAAFERPAETWQEAWKHVEGSYFLVREDRELALGRCEERYEPFQNRDAFAFLDALRPEGLRYHTAGALFDGRKVWALAKLANAGFEVRAGDRHETFVLVTAGHDGSTPITLAVTDVRVVCWNTLQAALRAGSSVRVIHTASAPERLAAGAKALGLAREWATEGAAIMGELEAQPMTVRDFTLFAAQVIQDVEGTMDEAQETLARRWEAASERGKSRLLGTVDELVETFVHGDGNRGATRYDALNAVTQWVDRKVRAGRYATKRMLALSRTVDSAWSGTGAARKARALRTLRAR